MSEVIEKGPGAKFVRKEREHLDVLQQRLAWLTGEGQDDPSRIPGETNAIAWALSIIEGISEPMEVRLQRYERKVRVIEARLGRLEHELAEDEDEL